MRSWLIRSGAVLLTVSGCAQEDASFCEDEAGCEEGFVCDLSGELQPAPGVPNTCVALDPCPTVDQLTIALFDFDSEPALPLTDVTGRHELRAFGAVEKVAGPPDCGGSAYRLGNEKYLTMNSHSDWETLGEGTIELWVRAPNQLAASGIVSRDAAGEVRDGHFELGTAPDGRAYFRLQREGRGGTVCSNEPLASAEWSHLAVTFGPFPALYVNGRPQNYATFISGDIDVDCGAGPNLTGGIAGNENPWIVGASTRSSTEGTADRLLYPFEGDVAGLRFSSAVREFVPLDP